jgi:hypothetical protein
MSAGVRTGHGILEKVNPGPSANTSSDSIKYPCYICNIPVLWSDKGVACDKCDQWYHAKCINTLILFAFRL